MPYSSTNRPYLVAGAVGGGTQGALSGGNIWIYRTSDAISTVCTAYYFTDDVGGMLVNDIVIVVNTASNTSQMCNVVDVKAGYGVTIRPSSSAPKGSFTLATGGATSTTVPIVGLLAESSVFIYPTPGTNAFYASAMYPDLYPSSQSAGSITFKHPATANTCTYNYLVSI